jgi:acetylornithine deacetylase/succinyl-diaminopimelate desuccinylase-like protein
VRGTQPAALAAVLAGIAAASPAPEAALPLPERVRAHVRSAAPDILREYAAFLALPNLASDADGIRRNAEHVVGMLRRRGVSARLLDGAGGPPAVYGAIDVGAARTVALYAHYDGQPVTASEWARPPWTPVLRDGPLGAGSREVGLGGLRGPVDGEWRLFARSSSDDKAPIQAIVSALDALAAAGVRPAVNVKLFFEGEEEAGSPHLRAVLEANRALLRADAWLLCDGPVHQSRRFQIAFGARGVQTLEITLFGPSRALHSGHYGNWAPNPAAALAHLVASLRDADGRILVPGFDDDVRPPSAAEREALAAFPDVDAVLREELALAGTEGQGARLVERILLPAMNVRGLASGAVGEEAANAIPTEARASIDFRLVPDQTPARVRGRVESHLRAQGYHVVHDVPSLEERRATPRLVRLQWGDGYPAGRTALDLPFSRRLAAAVASGTGEAPILLPTMGGSMPMHLFAEVTGAPVVILPIVNHDNSQHAADENLRLQNLWDGIAVFASVLTSLGSGW